MKANSSNRLFTGNRKWSNMDGWQIDMDQILCHRKQQQLYCFSKDATHNAWTISHLPVIHMLNYYWSVSLAVNVVFARPRCSHLKLDNVRTVCLGVCHSVCLCQPVHTDRPPTDCGNTTSWGREVNDGKGTGACVKHMWHVTYCAPSVNHTVNNEWFMPEQLIALSNAVMTSHKQRLT